MNAEIDTEQILAELVYQDINKFNIECRNFEIQKYFKEFIIVFNDKCERLEYLSDLQYNDNSGRDFILKNMTNEKWHNTLAKKFEQNNKIFQVKYYNKTAMMCTLW